MDTNTATNASSTQTTTAPAPVKEPSTREKFRSQPVMLAVTTNPKKNPSMSYDRFQHYFEHKYSDPKKLPTVADLLKSGVRMDDIRHDTDKGFIVVGQPAIDAYLKAEEKRKADELAAAKALVAASEKK